MTKTGLKLLYGNYLHIHIFWLPKRLLQSTILPTKFVTNIMLYMSSELPPLSKVGADNVFEHGIVNNFLNLFYNV